VKSDFIVSYHPTPFRSFKKVVCSDRTSRIVLECVANGIAVYSPHTASDAAVGGVNEYGSSLSLSLSLSLTHTHTHTPVG
jgi:putative NIF3 family GTP cyclohydrolase 1 type 2